MIYKLADAGNMGILVFLVMLGILVSLLNKAEVLPHLENGHPNISKPGLAPRFR